MLNSNEIAQVQRVAGLVYEGFVDTTDATPVTVWEYTLTAAEVAVIKVVCTALKSTSDGFVREAAKSFLYDGTTTTASSMTNVISATYLGSGLTTANFDITNSGSTVSVTWTGEASVSIRANFKIIVYNSINIVLS